MNARRRVPLALQLYSVRDAMKENLPGTLRKVAEMGYEGVEFAGFYDYTAADLRKILDDNGLACCGAHLGINTLLGSELEKTAEFNWTLGNPYLICPGLPGDYTGSRSNWRRTAEVFNDVSEKCRRLNCWVGYHNHHTEFTALDGEMPWDTFFGGTVHDVVMQLDTGNALLGGAQVGPFVGRYPYRALTVHLKPYSLEAGKQDPHAGYRPLFGDDSIPWAELFGQLEDFGGVRWYIVEYESDLCPPLQAVELCLRRLKEMGK
jgi:sugar phosphate isomerase/epimerase